MPPSNQQLALPFYTTRNPKTTRPDPTFLQASAKLERELEVLLGQNVELKVTNNQHTMISSKERNGVVRVRLHRMFLHADTATTRMLARFFLRRDRRAAKHIDDFIEANRNQIQKRTSRPPVICTRGQHHDLSQAFAQVNERYFNNSVKILVTWGQRSRTSKSFWRRQRSIHLGSYSPDDQIIRIHPVLDQNWVPEFFVHFVVYHELLHHVLPARQHNGRHRYHTSEFRQREQEFERYADAIAWEKRHISKLLRSSK